MKKSLSGLAMLAAAMGLTLGAAQNAKGDFWFVTAPSPTQVRTATRSGGWFVTFQTSLSTSTFTGGRVAPTQSNQMFGVATPFTAAIIVGCVQPRTMQQGTAQRSWVYNANNSYTALTKSCLGYGNATAMQGTMNIDL
jgi:hypothetical protein